MTTHEDGTHYMGAGESLHVQMTYRLSDRFSVVTDRYSLFFCTFFCISLSSLVMLSIFVAECTRIIGIIVRNDFYLFHRIGLTSA